MHACVVVCFILVQFDLIPPLSPIPLPLPSPLLSSRPTTGWQSSSTTATTPATRRIAIKSTDWESKLSNVAIDRGWVFHVVAVVLFSSDSPYHTG